MVDKLLILAPADVSLVPDWALLAAAAAGAVLYCCGARLSRVLYTVAFGAAGALVGYRLPDLAPAMAKYDPRMTAAGGAVVVGFIGYVFHRAWAATTLGVLLTAWAALATWVVAGPGEALTWPALPTLPVTQSSLVAYAHSLWQSVPVDVQHYLPLACGTAYVAGLATTFLWPRFGIALLHTLLGSTLMVVAAVLYAHNHHPEWLEELPRQPWSQPAILGTVVLVGFGLQYRARRPRAAAAAPAPAPAVVTVPPAED